MGAWEEFRLKFLTHLHWDKSIRVAGLGRLSAGANMAMKPFVKRVNYNFCDKRVVFVHNLKFSNFTQ